ncbi:hypothetical protein [Sphingosinicella sp.]|uniref:hypothetical protein n=1 Tax=Sphingosinicella sp. TaxID=1917971 RepID=UPI004037D06C
MPRLSILVLAAAAFLPAPAFAQSVPSGAEIEAMAPALDRVTGALLDVDVGGIIDAADPYARRPGYGRPGRTVGAMARRRDPYFDAHLRASIYGGTARAGRMMDAFAAAMPALRRSLDEARAAIGTAIDDYHRGLPPPAVDDGWDRDIDDEPRDERDPY